MRCEFCFRKVLPLSSWQQWTEFLNLSKQNVILENINMVRFCKFSKRSINIIVQESNDILIFLVIVRTVALHTRNFVRRNCYNGEDVCARSLADMQNCAGESAAFVKRCGIKVTYLAEIFSVRASCSIHTILLVTTMDWFLSHEPLCEKYNHKISIQLQLISSIHFVKIFIFASLDESFAVMLISFTTDRESKKRTLGMIVVICAQVWKMKICRDVIALDLINMNECP